MDYEKEYKEALERAKEIDNEHRDQCFDVMRKVFPELAESEDEKIRKKIIATICLYYGEPLEDEAKDMIAWLEKQVSPDMVADAYLRGCNDTEKKWLEKQGEQNPTDNVEPKFKVGDWIIDKQGITHQIKNVIENVTNHTFGYDLVGGGYFNEETEGVRLWTIQDAKDGDVLCCESGWTCIFKTLNSDNISFSSYCFMDNTGWFCKTGSEAHTLEKAFIKAYNGNIYPAAKEQRELLFQMMKEAGYEWDTEKKELKIIDWSKHIKYEPNNPSIIEQKPTWSEEDEEKFRDVIRLIEQGAPVQSMRDHYTNWLKSLKERMKGDKL